MARIPGLYRRGNIWWCKAIFVDGFSEKTTTRVEIVSKATWSVNMTAANWERRLFEVLDKHL
jgi:hypothetical protein